MAGFTEARFRRLAEIEREHFWFAGRRAVVDRLVRQHLGPAPLDILDAGCGTGATAERLARQGHRVVAFDERPEGVVDLAGRMSVVRAFRADAAHVPLPAERFDAAISLDVLEHVDDRAALSELARVLRTGAPLVLTVPALPGLWSHRDEAAGHRRRYTRRALTTLCRGAGFELEYVGYYQCLLLPVVVLSRWLGRRRDGWRDREDRPGRLLNRVLTAVELFEARAGRYVSWPVGSSLVIVCRKRPAR